MDPRPVVPTPGPAVAVDPFDGMSEKLQAVSAVSLRDQVAVFTDVHAALNAALAATAAGGDAVDNSPRQPDHRPGRPFPGGR